jgi:hypothetical protein
VGAHAANSSSSAFASFRSRVPNAYGGLFGREETLQNNTIVVVCVLALKTKKRSIINILSTRCVVGLVSKNFRTSPAGASPPTSPAHGAYKFKRQPTGDVLAIDRIKEIHAHRRGGRFSS